MSVNRIEVAGPEHLTTQVPHNDELLCELEALAKGRYTEEDNEYMKEFSRQSPPPPLVAPEARRQRFNRGRGDWHGAPRGRDHYNNQDRDNRSRFYRDNRDGYERNNFRGNRGGYQRDHRDYGDGYASRGGFQQRDHRDDFNQRNNRDGFHQGNNRDSSHYRNNRDSFHQRDDRGNFNQRSYESSNNSTQQSSSSGLYGGGRDGYQDDRHPPREQERLPTQQ